MRELIFTIVKGGGGGGGVQFFFFGGFEKKYHNLIHTSYVYMSKCRQFEGLSTGIFTWTIPNHTIKLQLHRRGTSSFE